MVSGSPTDRKVPPTAKKPPDSKPAPPSCRRRLRLKPPLRSRGHEISRRRSQNIRTVAQPQRPAHCQGRADFQFVVEFHPDFHWKYLHLQNRRHGKIVSARQTSARQTAQRIARQRRSNRRISGQPVNFGRIPVGRAQSRCTRPGSTAAKSAKHQRQNPHRAAERINANGSQVRQTPVKPSRCSQQTSDQKRR